MVTFLCTTTMIKMLCQFMCLQHRHSSLKLAHTSLNSTALILCEVNLQNFLFLLLAAIWSKFTQRTRRSIFFNRLRSIQSEDMWVLPYFLLLLLRGVLAVDYPMSFPINNTFMPSLRHRFCVFKSIGSYMWYWFIINKGLVLRSYL